ncbi:MAG: HDOD domain-containing protein [Gammaproteobacteria bacterium]|nr:HDOD domain-containing protein [Gammaproteobacteria bacterium]
MTELKRNGMTGLEQLNTLKLPSLPAGTPYLIKSLSNENIDFAELASIVEKFPSIAGKLISLANSVWSAPASAITSLEDACARLGFDVVRSTSIALAIATPFNPTKCPAFDPEYFWYSALMTADAACRLVPVLSSSGNLKPSSARAAGLLHNLGLLWLVDSFPDEVHQALTMVKKDQFTTLQQALLQILGFDQMQAGGHLASRWELSEPLVLVMTHYSKTSYQGPQREIITTVGLAVKLVSNTLKEVSCTEQETRQWNSEISRDDLSEVSEQLNKQIVNIRAIAKELF